MPDGLAELRQRHDVAIERIRDLGRRPASPEHATARELWEGKLVQIHCAALLNGVELCPLDDDRCSTCGLHVPTLQHMQRAATAADLT